MQCSRASRGANLQRAALLALVLAVFLVSVDAKPPSFDFLLKGHDASLLEDDNECYLKGEVEELCQRCAKLTKSEVVYPMCCQDQEAAREWCDKYLHFGV